MLDLACGTGNAALIAAARGAHVIGVDAARGCSGSRGSGPASWAWRPISVEGDLLALPVPDGSADVIVSVFGVIFAPDPARALGEVARTAAAGARIYLSAWIPAGPINDMLAAVGRVIARVTEAPPARRFAWSDPVAVEAAAVGTGLSLHGTRRTELAIRAASPEAYVTAGREHPMSLAVRPMLEKAGVDAEAYGAMIDVLREANEDPGGFLVHSPYVVHELRA